MKIELWRDSIHITYENPQDLAFIEDTLGLKNDGDSIELKRKNKVEIDSVTMEVGNSRLLESLIAEKKKIE